MMFALACVIHGARFVVTGALVAAAASAFFWGPVGTAVVIGIALLDGAAWIVCRGS